MKHKWIAALLGLGVALSATASPISYNQNLQNGVPVVGWISDTSTEFSPVGAQYYSFLAAAGSSVTVIGDRLEGAFDMAFWLFQGLFNDTDDFGGSFDTGDAGFVAFGDDQDSPNIAGPWGDPRVTFLTPSSGYYTVAVTNYWSEPSGDGMYDFQLVARGIQNVPEPASLGLLGLGLFAVAASRRRSRSRIAPVS